MSEKANEREANNQQGVQSVEVGARLLNALIQSSASLSLKNLAAAAGMSPSKAHRYLVSLIRAGLAHQDRTTGRYDLGHLSLRLGLASLARLDAVRVGTDAVLALRERVDLTTLLTVWGDRGATVVRWEDASRPVIVNAHVGSILPVLSSASGRVYLAHLPQAAAQPLVETELAELRRMAPQSPLLQPKTVERLVKQVRAEGISRISGDMLPGLAALAAPIFDFQRHLVAVVALLGRQGAFDRQDADSPEGHLRAVAADASRTLGFGPS